VDDAPAAAQGTRSPEVVESTVDSGSFATERPELPVTIAFAGDTHFEGSLASLLGDPDTALASLAPTLSAADLTVVNLETAITTGGTETPKDFTFRAPPVALDVLRSAGVDVVSLANNHGMDFGADGLADSLAAGRDREQPIIGAGSSEAEAYAPWTTTIRGQRIAVIGATQVLDSELIAAWSAEGDELGLASAKRELALLDSVRTARETADTVVVFLHWGTERQECPNDAQLDLAPKLVEAGADMIVGGHAHRLQGAGMLDGAFVAYGLGNFVWYNGEGANGDTGILTVTVTGRRIDDWTFTPARIRGGIPQVLEGDAASAALQSFDELRSCTGLAGPEALASAAPPG
jgi:poly-gamma-glutamate synthesis protein (capsule biosynthesis protein)